VPASALSEVASFQAAVLTWYASHGRRLNFRRRRDAYAVLVSEAMAQQTQISRVEPAWEAFLARFPSVEALASAATADVLRAWAGMGYNRRALNLQRAARVIVDELAGVFPASIADLERLPGVGPYTARAIAAIAFGQAVGAVDTNVRRVLGRVVAGWDGLPAVDLQRVADAFVPAGRAGEWTHAVMDVGARLCRLRTPVCSACPAQLWCAAAAEPRLPQSRPPGRGRRTGPGRAVARAPGSGVPFRATSRWLRGRLLDLARAAEGNNWVAVDAPIESHGVEAVAAAVRALAAEGLLELHPTHGSLARLPN
jgi:A/G-specific adenine glycosylase